MEQFILIYTKDYSFSSHLAISLEKRKELSFQSIPFDDGKKLYSFLSTNAECILIVDEEYMDELMELGAGEFAISKIILFTENKSNIKMDTIYKYQSVDSIIKEIIQVCAEIDNIINKAWMNSIKDRNNQRNKEIIGIYSPIKRCMQTSFSLVYCSLKAKNKKTLYLNFEIFSGFSRWFDKEYGADFMDLLYFIDSEPQKFILRLSGMVETFGDFHYIPPSISYEDFMEVTQDQWLKLIDLIIEYSDYEVIVLDLGEHVRGLFSILERCSKIYTITKQDPLAISKVTEYEEMMRLSNHEEIIKKTVKTNLPVFKDVSKCADDLPYGQLANYIKHYMKEEFQLEKSTSEEQ